METPPEVQRLESWVESYVRAWESNDPDDIGALFAEEARYFTAPHREPWVGRDAIVNDWLDRKDELGTWRFRWKVLFVSEDGPSFVQGETDYDDGPNYSNLWLIRLDDDGRCTEFTEWWMERD